MSGALQAVFQNQRSFIPPLAIGDAYQGGYFAGQISTAGNSIADYNLVIGPISSAQSTLTWKGTNTATTGATSVIDGPQNTADMVAQGATYTAANFCDGLVIGGFSDWSMPARNELEVCYYNLKPTTTSNFTTAGINANAVPARASNYTAGTPAQTTATDFKDTGAEDFATNNYWSSTISFSYNPQYYALWQTFNSGFQGYQLKNTSTRVRAVRRVAV